MIFLRNQEHNIFDFRRKRELCGLHRSRYWGHHTTLAPLIVIGQNQWPKGWSDSAVVAVVSKRRYCRGRQWVIHREIEPKEAGRSKSSGPISSDHSSIESVQGESGFDKTLTPGQLTPYKVNGKMRMKKSPELSMGLDSSSSINLSYLKLPRWRSRCRFPTPFSFD